MRTKNAIKTDIIGIQILKIKAVNIVFQLLLGIFV